MTKEFQLILNQVNMKQPFFLREWFAHYGKTANTVLLPQSAIGKSTIPVFLEGKGIACNRIPLYDTILPSDALTKLETALQLHPNFLAVFASPSAWRNFLHVLRQTSFNRPFRIASIGEVTTAAIKQDGYNVQLEPKLYTMNHLIDLIIEERSK
ncbi:uroporphyrinogen-III synthase [Listeria floridensis FSL S10-1187]|uniref:Uroporphyrinogen-III synthase n=2 Tax=Listeria floridensis TaxID=1494962 RepID=A0ABN0RHA9_9LIST|nr:uroporphyrinogen-III synthase [Listeria floridensis FSL S10-1187]